MLPEKIDPLADLTREKTLWDVRATVATIPRRDVYRYKVIEIAAGVFALAYAFGSHFETETVNKLIEKLMEQGFSVAVQVLSFSLAGLAIFAGALASDMAKPMLDVPYPKTQLSTLKVNALAFVRVFFACLLMVVAYFLWLLIFAKGSLAYQFFRFLFNSGRAWDFVLACGLGAATALVAHLVVTVQVFLFDLHHVVMTFARAKISLDKRGRTLPRSDDLS